MYSAKIGVFEESDKRSLSGLLKSTDSRALEAKTFFEVLSDLTNMTLEWKLTN
jgi:hypothetical protein